MKSGRCLLLFSLIALSVLAAASGPATKARQALDKGASLEAAGKLDEALEQYGRAVAEDPSSTEAWRKRGLLQMKRKAYADALSDLDRAVKLDAKDVEAIKGRAWALSSLERFPDARDAAAKAIAQAPKDPAAYYRRAFPRFRLRDFEGCVEDSTKAIGLKADYAHAYRLRGIALSFLVRHREGLADLDKAIALDDSSDLTTYHYRGICRRAVGDLKGALADADHVLGLKLDDIPGLLERGLVRTDLGAFGAALEDFRRVLERQPKNSTALEGIARIEALSAKAGGKAEAPPPELPDVPDLRGYKDEKILVTAVRTDPSPVNRYVLAKVRFAHALELAEASEKDLDEDALFAAIQYAESAATLAPDNAAYWLMVGRLYAHMDENPVADAAAEEALTTALRLDAGLEPARRLLAYLYFKCGSFDRALGELEPLVLAGPGRADSETLAMMGWAYQYDFQLDRGVAFFRKLRAKQPDAAGPRIGLAALLAVQGKDEEAAKEMASLAGDGIADAASREYARALLADWGKGGGR